MYDPKVHMLTPQVAEAFGVNSDTLRRWREERRAPTPVGNHGQAFVYQRREVEPLAKEYRMQPRRGRRPLAKGEK